MKKIGETLIENGTELHREVREKTVAYIVTGFSVVAGLAWNDAIKAFIEKFFPDPGSGLKAKFLYAALITLVVVLISVYLSKLFKLDKKKEVEEKKEEKIKENKKAPK